MENWQQRFIRNNPLIWALMQMIMDFMWFGLKFTLWALIFYYRTR